MSSATAMLGEIRVETAQQVRVVGSSRFAQLLSSVQLLNIVRYRCALTFLFAMSHLNDHM